MDAAMHDRGSRAFTFLSSRLHAIAGYLDRPALSAGMRFILPTGFSILSSRFVPFSTRLMEIWSPNSTQIPFYPGLREPTFAAGRQLPTEWRRSDGHAGRFDPTVSPQHFDPSLPWLGFIRRSYDASLPEFESILSHWEPSGPGNRGSFRLEFVSRLRDRYEDVQRRMNSRSQIERLAPTLWRDRPSSNGTTPSIVRGELSFDDAVDNLAHLQVEIKFMDAWARMADAVMQLSSSTEPLRKTVDKADDSLVGIWLNDVSETAGLRMLRFRVPCFIISEVLNAEDIARAARQPKALNFINGTPIAGLNTSLYSIEIAIQQAGGILRDLQADLGIASSTPTFSTSEKDQASPSSQLRLSNTPPRPTPAANPSLAPSNPEILPPPVAGVGPGKWSLWTVSNMDNEAFTECMEQLGARRKEDKGKYRYFDRQRQRYLCFDEKVPIPASYRADPKIFGLPVPSLPFVQRENSKTLASRSASTWMYLTEKPDPKDANRAYVPYRAPPAAPQQAIVDHNRDRSPAQPTSSKHPRSPNNGRYSAGSSSPLQVPRSPPNKRRATMAPRSFGSSAFRQHQSIPQRPSLFNRLRSPPPHRVQGDYYRPRSRSPTGTNHRKDDGRDHRGSAYSRDVFHRDDTRRPQSPRPRRSPSRSPPRFQTHSHPVHKSPPPSAAHSRNHSPPRRPSSPSPIRGRRTHSLGKGRDTSSYNEKRKRSPSPSRSRSRSSDYSDEDSYSDGPSDSGYYYETPAPAVVVSQTRSGGLSFTETLASSSSAVIPYEPSLPQGTLLQRFRRSSRDQSPRQSQPLLWNLPAAFIWHNVVHWILMVLPLAGNPPLERVLRTNESGTQVFWLKFRTVAAAISFRGVVASRHITDGGLLVHCDFILTSDYAGANGRSSDYWENSGLSYDRSLDSEFSDLYCPRAITGPGLAARLGMEHVSSTYNKPTKSKRRRTNQQHRYGYNPQKNRRKKFNGKS
ncbi:hypothetical protein BJ912DRAFT_1067413 [Pholiota molesta]|nr:hypothetical protein BJ912DRAFT_1067413 [Pholiota molesta]